MVVQNFRIVGGRDLIKVNPSATLFVARPQKNRAKPESKRAKRKGGMGGNEFLPACLPAEDGQWGGKRFRNSALAEYQNRKIFVSLIENNLGACE